jgi:aminopeptidase
MDKKLIDTYADLVVKQGINLQKNKSVLIVTGPGTYYFARALAKAAYRAGALHTQILLDDLDVLAERLNNQDEQQLKENPAYMKSLDYEMCAEGWSYIRIDSTEDRLDHAPLDREKNRILGTAKRKFSATRSDKLMRHQLPWCVCCAPGPLWAKQVLGEEATEDDMLEVLKPILLLDRDDPIAAWEEHDKKIKERQNKLNSLHIDSMHFKSPVTDFTIGFDSHSRFIGGSETLPDSRVFFPNIPSEELFTTPDMHRANGYITTTRPVSVLNSRTEEIRLEFIDGKVVNYSAKVGKDVMDAFFSIDEGTKRIGECALVDESNPIAQSNLVFDSILLDENASCHIALGEAYPSCLTNGELLTTKEELHEYGCNTSLMHVDFMVGSKEMDITATTREGKEVLLMRKGLLVF